MKETVETDAATGLDTYGKRGLAVSFVGILLGVPALFIPAGRLDWANAWVFIGLTLVYQVFYTVFLAKVNPGMLNERGKFVKEGTKKFDKVYAAAYLPLAFTILIVAGLDARYHWSSAPVWVSVVGVILVIPAFALGLWAMAVNPFFEVSVRIQDDRGQSVVASGPYSRIRHPGYSALVLSTLMYPLILGSWWAYVPAVFLALVVVARTALEDRTLRVELPGYCEYASDTRYRLVPLVW
jgi:protein-S-isoprenylcysteine O-methyltransferase Ste14